MPDSRVLTSVSSRLLSTRAAPRRFNSFSQRPSSTSSNRAVTRMKAQPLASSSRDATPGGSPTPIHTAMDDRNIQISPTAA